MRHLIKYSFSSTHIEVKTKKANTLNNSTIAHNWIDSARYFLQLLELLVKFVCDYLKLSLFCIMEVATFNADVMPCYHANFSSRLDHVSGGR